MFDDILDKASFPGVVRTLLRLRLLNFLVERLQHKEGLLLVSMVRHQALTIEIILNARQCSSWAAKIFQYPWRATAKKRDALEHGDLMLVQVCLILLSPACKFVAVKTEERVATEFAHDEGLIVSRAPIHLVRVRRKVNIPTDVLVVP